MRRTGASMGRAAPFLLAATLSRREPDMTHREAPGNRVSSLYGRGGEGR